MIREDMFDVLGNEPIVRLVGHVNNETLKSVSKGLPMIDRIKTSYMFATHSSFDINLGHEFAVIFNENNPSEFCERVTQLHAVTQQFGKPFDLGIPRGWKTIVAIKFLNDIPDIITSMPHLETWFEQKPTNGIILSSCSLYKSYYNQFITPPNSMI